MSDDLAPPRSQPRQPGDFVIGCGQPAEGQKTGRSCAGVGTEPSCQLCPQSPTYWRRDSDLSCSVRTDDPDRAT